MSAAGIAGLLRAVLAIHHREFPPQAGFARWHPDLEPLSHRFDIPTRACPWESGERRAAVVAFGFGGTNACALLEQAPEAKLPISPGPHLFVCSASSPSLLRRYLESLRGVLPDLPLDAAACTQTMTRSLEAYAAAFTATTHREADRALGHLVAALQNPPDRLSPVGEGWLGPSRQAGPIPDGLLGRAAAWIQGGPEDLADLFPHPRIVSLPPVPLKRERCWVLRSPGARGETTGDLAREVADLVARVGGFSPERVTARHDLVGNLGFDSLLLADLKRQLAMSFGPAAPGEDFWKNPPTVEEIADFVASRARPEPADAFPEVKDFVDRLEAFNAAGNPYFQVPPCDVVDFSSYDYLGLSRHPEVVAAAIRAIETCGTSVSASRLVSGERPVHRELERDLADFLRVEDSLVMVSGHATNTTTIPCLVGPGDAILHDERIHDSALQGARASGASRQSFPHNDVGALDRILRRERARHRRVLIVVEGVYSMDGDLPDLPALVEVRDRHRSVLMVDEAHSLGVLGATGRGLAEHWGVDPARVDLWMGTLSKALASCGGYVAGRAGLIAYLRYHAPGFVFSVGMPPAQAGAARAAL
ncbi:MAG: aminotransferase class I/II-fold pyridoxal phosphate-dependent enzyme, partial [Candidatus Eremiobacterota bacterium]